MKTYNNYIKENTEYTINFNILFKKIEIFLNEIVTNKNHYVKIHDHPDYAIKIWDKKINYSSQLGITNDINMWASIEYKTPIDYIFNKIEPYTKHTSENSDAYTYRRYFISKRKNIIGNLNNIEFDIEEYNIFDDTERFGL